MSEKTEIDQTKMQDDLVEAAYESGFISGATSAFWSIAFVLLLALLLEKLRCTTSFRLSRE